MKRPFPPNRLSSLPSDCLEEKKKKVGSNSFKLGIFIISFGQTNKMPTERFIKRTDHFKFLFCLLFKTQSNNCY